MFRTSSILKIIVLLIVGAALPVALLVQSQHSNEETIQSLKQSSDKKLSDSAKQISQLQAEIIALRAQAAVTPACPVCAPPANAEVTPTQETSQQTSEREFAANVYLSNVNKLLALSAAEQDQLRHSLNAGLKRGESGREILKQSLGPDKFSEYAEKKLADSKAARREMSEQEAYEIGRKLELSSDQEKQIASVIQNSRDEFFPPRSLADDTTLIRNTDAARDLLSKERERRKKVAEQLRPILSDTQYNRFLEIEATSSANVAHDSFVDLGSSSSSTALQNTQSDHH